MQTMLNENDIVKLLSDYLDRTGYKVTQSLDTNSKGIDIIAVNLKNNERLFIEVKGETSSKETTNRFGKPFTPNQITNHVARAILATFKVLASKPAGNKTKVAIAFPLTAGHQKEIEKIKTVLNEIDIKVYFVGRSNIIEL